MGRRSGNVECNFCGRDIKNSRNSLRALTTNCRTRKNHIYIYGPAVREYEEEYGAPQNPATKFVSEGDPLPTFVPQLKRLPTDDRLKALARMNGGHLSVKYVVDVWRDTFKSDASKVSGHVYRLLKDRSV
ncbi:MAG: hypothetical protein ACYCOU_13945 [Sulfobacillus sp.]